MSVKITISGLQETNNYLKGKNTKTKSLAKAGLTKAAIFMQGEVKMSIAGQRAETRSVDTGRFLNAVDLAVGTKDAVIFSALPYAKFLEFGTSRFPARKHFRNTKDRNKGKAVAIMQKEINKL